jgi:serine/threonine protein kinase
MSVITDMDFINFFKKIIKTHITSNRNIVNGFLVNEKIFESYSGKIYKGSHKITSKKVILKFCKKKKDWIREVNALKILSHPNVVKLVGDYKCDINVNYDNIGNCSLMALEYAKNGDLYSFLKKNNNVNEKVGRTIGKQILEGLVHAYYMGVSHRDIKLENIFISEKGKIIVGDWGLCSFDCNDRLSESSCGTLGYMAPEILCKMKYDPSKADVWSFGTLLFSLISGCRPYSEPESRKKNIYDKDWKDEWLDSIMKKKWDIFWKSHLLHSKINFSDELKDLIECCFEPKFMDRIDIITLLDHKWFDGETISDSYIVELSS